MRSTPGDYFQREFSRVRLSEHAAHPRMYTLLWLLICTGCLIATTGQSAAPSIGSIPDQTVLEDQPTPATQLSLADDATSPANLTLTGSSSNPSVVPDGNIFFGSAGGNRYITVPPAFGQTGTATITVNATDQENLTATTHFLITVNPPPAGALRFANTSPITIN